MTCFNIISYFQIQRIQQLKEIAWGKSDSKTINDCKCRYCSNVLNWRMAFNSIKLWIVLWNKFTITLSRFLFIDPLYLFYSTCFHRFMNVKCCWDLNIPQWLWWHNKVRSFSKHEFGILYKPSFSLFLKFRYMCVEKYTCSLNIAIFCIMYSHVVWISMKSVDILLKNVFSTIILISWISLIGGHTQKKWTGLCIHRILP